MSQYDIGEASIKPHIKSFKAAAIFKINPQKKCILILLGKPVKNKFLFTMTAYSSQTQTTLGQLCTALWDSLSQPVVIEPGFEPGCL